MSSDFTQPGSDMPLGTLPRYVEPVSPAADLQVAGYELLGVLGRGGMGVVYKARQLKLDRLVALKMLPADWRSQPDLLARFRNEAAAVARLQHPNIVQIFEVGESAHGPFLALEFVGGGTLGQFLNRSPQPAELAATLTESLARAVEHAHQQGILHRDLKPSNVLLTSHGDARTAATSAGLPLTSRDRTQALPLDGVVPKIADFGLAKHLNASDGPTQPGDIIGTPNYMAPEQAGGVTLRPTPAIDIYALGAILYEMLTGRPPFLGATPTETVVQVLSQDPVPPRQLRPDCPRDLETIALKCLSKDPNKRYPTAAALADDLGRWKVGEPIMARPAGPVERLIKWTRRYPAVAASIGAGIVLLVVSVVYAIQLRNHNRLLRDSEREQRIARERAEANFQIARRSVKDLLAEVGAEDLRSVPHMDLVRRSLLSKALAAMKTLLEQDRHNLAVRREFAEIAGDVGEVHAMLGQADEAEQYLKESHREYRALVEAHPDQDDLRLDYAKAALRLADFHLDASRPLAAEPLYQEALAAVEELLRRQPDHPDYSQVRARVLINRGQLWGSQSRQADAVRDFSRARDLLLSLVQRHPDRRDIQELLAIVQNNLGVEYHTVQALDQAAAAYGAACQIYRDLMRANPGDRSYRLRLGVAATNLAYTQWWRDKAQETHAAYREALDTLRALVRDYPGVPEYQSKLARALEQYGEVLDYAKQSQGRLLMQEALKLREDVVRQQPNRPSYIGGLGQSCEMQASAMRRAGNWAEAAQWEQRAIEQYRQALQSDPKSRVFRESLREELKRHAGTLLRCNQPGEALAALGEYIGMQ